MLINFRQGIFTQPLSVGQPNFLQITGPGVSFVNVTTTDPVIVDFAQGQSDYLFQETNSIPAWVISVTPSTNAWLYWDISLLTGIRTFGYTNWMPVDSPTAPTQSTSDGLSYLPLQVDQHWFDMVNFLMKVWNGSVWVITIRCFAGSIRGGILVQNGVGSQAGLTNVQINAGYLLFDDDNKPVKKYAAFNLGEFITTTSPLASQFSKIQNYRLETAVQTAQATGTIAQFKAVCYTGIDEIGQASCNTIPAGGLSYPAVGVATTAIFAGEVTDFVVSGFINDPQGTFNTANTFTPGKFVFVDPFGSLTTTPPTSGSLQRVGFVVDPTTIYLDIQPQIVYGSVGNIIPIQLDRDTGNIIAENIASTNSGTVTSVAAVGSVGLNVAGSPITSNGTLTFTLNGELQGLSGLSANGFVQRTGVGTYVASNLTSLQVVTALGFTPYNVSNPANYISAITSGMITAALGYTPYSAANPSGYISSAVTSAVAGTGISVSSATGAVMFTNTGVLSFNSRTGVITLTSADVTNALGYTPTSSTGTVTSVSVTTANGVSGSVVNPTTTPAITLTLGNITPTSVIATGVIGGSNFSGSTSGINTGDQTITLTGDVTGSGTGSFATTLSNTAVTAGSYTLANITVDAKGRITAASSGSAGGTGTVTSVAATGSTGLSVGGSPITTSGTLTFTLNAELQGLSGLSSIGYISRTGAGSYSISSTIPGGSVLGDISGNAANVNGIIAITNGGTGLSFLGTANQLLGVNAAGTAAEYKTLVAGTGISSIINAANSITINASGTVSSVGVSSTDLTITNSPITSSGTIGLTLNTVNGNVGTFGTGTNVGTFTVNAKGLITAASNTAITFPVTSFNTRTGAITLTSGDVTTALGFTPGTGSVTSIAVTGTADISVTGSPITTSGTVALALQPTAVTAGSYLNTNITVDANGRITAASNGASGALPLTTKGDILGYDTAPNRVPVGPNGYILTADSTNSLGVSWQPTGAGTGTVTSVAASSTGGDLSITGSPITASGTIDFELTTQGGVTAGAYTNAGLTVNSKGVITAVSNGTAVSSFNTRTGAVTLLSSDVTTATPNVSSFTNDAGYLTANQNIAVTGDATGSGATSIALTLATVNPNVGTFGSGTTVPVITVNGKGLTTAVTTTAIVFPVTSFNTRTGAITLTSGDVTTALGFTPGTGTVTTVSVATANGVSGSVSNPTTTPAITLTLGAITPTSVVATGSVTGSNLSGTNTGDQTITLTGDVTGSGTGSFATTLASVGTPVSNSFVKITTDTKGRVTATSAVTAGDVETALGFTPGTGNGTVTSVAVSGSNGIGVVGSPITSSGTITLSLGAITPTSVNASGTLTGSNFSGSSSGANTGDQTITLTGAVTGSGTGSFATTLATVNGNVGTFGNATNVGTFTVNNKGLITSASNTAITFPVTSVFGRTGVVVAATNDYSFSQISGSIVASQLPALSATGDATGTGSSGTGSIPLTLATVNANVGSFTNANITVNAKGLITAASNGSGGSGTVTSVAFSDASTTPIYSITGSPVTTSGTLTQTLTTQTANTVFAGPTTGAAAQPTFRALVAKDIPTNGVERVVWRYSTSNTSNFNGTTPVSTTSGVSVVSAIALGSVATYAFTGYDHPPISVIAYGQQTNIPAINQSQWSMTILPNGNGTMADTGTNTTPNLLTSFTASNTMTLVSDGSVTNASDSAGTGAYLILEFKF